MTEMKTEVFCARVSPQCTVTIHFVGSVTREAIGQLCRVVSVIADAYPQSDDRSEPLYDLDLT